MHEANQGMADLLDEPPAHTDGLIPLSTVIDEILTRLAAQRMPGSTASDGML